MLPLQGIGLSHSEIHGSRVICTSPWLIAAYHVLHRLREPRHPPCALSYFPYHVHAHLTMRAGWYILLAFVLKLLLLVTSCHRPFLLWRITDSNRWPPACKAGALASWANPPFFAAAKVSILLCSCKILRKFFSSFLSGSPRQSWTADLYIISVAL